MSYGTMSLLSLVSREGEETCLVQPGDDELWGKAALPCNESGEIALLQCVQGRVVAKEDLCGEMAHQSLRFKRCTLLLKVAQQPM